MPKTVEIEAGDCVDSIAYKERVSSDVIWNDDQNKPLRELGRDRNALLHRDSTGTVRDKLYVPDPEIVWHPGRHTTLTHVFKRTLPKREFKFQVLMGEALKGFKYKVEIDGEEVKAEPDKKDGSWITCQIKPDAKEAVITLYYPQGQLLNPVLKKEHQYRVDLGHLRPVDTVEGQEDRLRNLGFFAPRPDETLPDGKEPTFAEALLHFQASYEIDPADKATVDDTLKALTGDPD